MIHSEEMITSIQTAISWLRMNHSKEDETKANFEQTISKELEQNLKVGTSQAIEKQENEYVTRNIASPILLPLDNISDDFVEDSWKLIGKIWIMNPLRYFYGFQAISSKSNSSVRKKHRNQIAGRKILRTITIYATYYHNVI